MTPKAAFEAWWNKRAYPIPHTVKDAWLAAWTARGEQDAKIAEDMIGENARAIAAAIRNQK